VAGDRAGDGDELSTLMRPTSSPLVPPDGAFVLTVVEGLDLGLTLRADAASPSPVLVGTSPACDLRLTDREVSRRHLGLGLVTRRLHVRDLGSKNGTLVDGVSLVEGYLRGGETVRLGSTALSVTRVDEGKTPSIPFATSFGRVLGASTEMRRLYPLCQKLAASNVPVIIEGETGTGKEQLAEALHEMGPRAQASFVVFDCTAVAPSLVEAELFGHERGAFTGAVAARKGVFEQASGGTLLIDEIGDLDLSLQPKLLRALERGEIRRMGGTGVIKVDVRLVAATRRDLDHEVQSGRFRDDLFHRLAVARIELPPLRRRTGDVNILAHHFARAFGGEDAALPQELVRKWEDSPWPGNVRELRNAVARHLALGDLAAGPAPVDLAPEESDALGSLDAILALDLPLVQARQRVMAAFEQRYLERLVTQHGGNVSRAAAASGVALRHFQRLRAKIKRP
jgi:DNA-binding NtrC family response regulator